MNITKGIETEFLEKQCSKNCMFTVTNGKIKEECDWGRWTDQEHRKFLDLIITTKTLNWKKVIIMKLFLKKIIF